MSCIPFFYLCFRWYVDHNIRWFFICSTVAATTSLLCLIITAAALAAVQEQRSNEELHRSIYYDQHSEQNKNLPPTFHDFSLIYKDPIQQLRDNSEQTNILGSLGYSQNGFQHDATQQQTSENDNSEHQEIHEQITSGNIIQNTEISPDDTNTSTYTPVDRGPAMWKLPETKFKIKNAEHEENGARHISEMMQNDSKTRSEMLPTVNIGHKTNNELTHIMRIANIKTNKPMHVFSELLNDHDQKLDPPANTSAENQFNRPKKSTDDSQNKGLLDDDDGHLRTVITEDEHIHLMTLNNEETQDVMTIPSIKYGTHDEENVSCTICNTDDSNETLAEYSTSEQKFEQEPKHDDVRRSAREVRTVVAINILVASALELVWSVLSASIAWKGMRNYYPHDNTTSSDRTVEGLETSLPPPPPSPNNTYTTNIRHHKTDGVFRKPDIISNHRHSHTGNSNHLSIVHNNNNINRLQVINTVSERINLEPYLPMEESTMEYQERVHRFLASNNVVNNTSDHASNIDS